MLASKLRLLVAVSLTLALMCAGSTVSMSSAPEKPAERRTAGAGNRDKQPFSPLVQANRRHLESVEWYVRSVHHNKGTISLEAKRVNTWGSGVVYVETPSGQPGPSGLYLNHLKTSRQPRITINDKPAQLKDLSQGMRVSVRFAPDSFTLDVIAAVPAPQPPRFIIREVHPRQRTITVSLDTDQLTLFERLPVAEDANIEVHSSSGLRKVSLNDLSARMTVHIELRPDGSGRGLLVNVIKAAK